MRELGMVRIPVDCAPGCESVSRTDVIRPRFSSIASAGDSVLIVSVKDDQTGLDCDHRLDHRLNVRNVITGEFWDHSAYT